MGVTGIERGFETAHRVRDLGEGEEEEIKKSNHETNGGSEDTGAHRQIQRERNPNSSGRPGTVTGTGTHAAMRQCAL